MRACIRIIRNKKKPEEKINLLCPGFTANLMGRMGMMGMMGIMG